MVVMMFHLSIPKLKSYRTLVSYQTKYNCCYNDCGMPTGLAAYNYPCTVNCYNIYARWYQCSIAFLVELQWIVNLLSGYPDPNSSRIVTSSVFYLYLNSHMLKVQLIKYLKHIFTVLTLILNTFSSYKKY